MRFFTLDSEFTYAAPEDAAWRRASIHLIEQSTRKPRLWRLYADYCSGPAAGDFFAEALERLSISLAVERADLQRIPREGPLVVVANHPYGILDGLAMGRILSAARGGDFKIIANNVFKKALDLDRIILPIDFAGTKDAVKRNIEARREALDYVARGGAIGIFPGGTVSTSAHPFGRPLDPAWRTFTAKMIARSDAAVVPIYFEGQNSRLFQIASHLNPTLRLALLINEFDARVGGALKVHVGKPLPEAEIASRRRDPTALMDYLRAQTYRLSPEPVKGNSYGLYLG